MHQLANHSSNSIYQENQDNNLNIALSNESYLQLFKAFFHHISHLEAAIYHGGNADDFHVKVADTVEEACKLIETGFEYVTDMEGKKLFRKRK